VPKPSGSSGKSKADKTAPITRTNMPDKVACPACATGLQDVETCTVCDGTGRVTPDRARQVGAPRTADGS
jgi:DnaJ-class molecular chaperone